MLPHYGEELQAVLDKFDVFDQLKVPENVFKGVSKIPSEADVAELKKGFATGEFNEKEFLDFCNAHQYEPSADSAISASCFIELKRGRLVARLECPRRTKYEVLNNLYPLIERCNMLLIDPETGEEAII
jgi:hypothetical protein